MEIGELKTIWQQYDLKLNNLEKLNKKLVLETLSRKPQSKINWMRYRSIYVLFMIPILIVVLYPYIKIEYIDWKMIIGCILSLSVVINWAYIYLENFGALKGINLAKDPIIESAQKITDYKSIFNRRQKFVWITYPVLFAGILLITWNAYTFNTKTILFMAGLFIFALLLGIKQFKEQKQRIDRLEKEILELNEYKD